MESDFIPPSICSYTRTLGLTYNCVRSREDVLFSEVSKIMYCYNGNGYFWSVLYERLSLAGSFMGGHQLCDV